LSFYFLGVKIGSDISFFLHIWKRKCTDFIPTLDTMDRYTLAY
jgi:hypothetical protein